jgi:hypothetical protein
MTQFDSENTVRLNQCSAKALFCHCLDCGSFERPHWQVSPYKKTMNKFKFNWQPWARLQSLTAATFILIGSLIEFLYPNKILMAVHLVTALLIIALEYPFINLTNYYAKALLYILVAGGAMLQAPTHTGGLCLVCAAVTYGRAAYNGENGNPPPPKGK